MPEVAFVVLQIDGGKPLRVAQSGPCPAPLSLSMGTDRGSWEPQPAPLRLSFCKLN